ncbi:hypothetical protein AADZ86_00945 [Colwelliaceae bacterium BS250]
MALEKLIDIASKSLKIAIPSIMLGSLVTYLIFDSMILSGKNSEISNLNASIEVEKGHQKVLNERIKLLGDKAIFIENRLKYKPEMAKEKEVETASQLKKLTEDNQYLLSLKSKLEKVEGKKIDTAKLEIKLEGLVQNNNTLKTELSRYQSEILVDNHKLEFGESWAGFGGQITFGLGRVDYSGNEGNTAKVTSSIFAGNLKEVSAGEKFEFSVADNKYTLVVSNVNYVGSYISISVYKI